MDRAGRRRLFVTAALLLALLAPGGGCGSARGNGSDGAAASRLVVLCSDYDASGYSLMRLKGEITAQYPSARIADGAVGMPAFDLISAAYIIDLGSRPFADGTVFVCVVNPDDTPGSDCLVAERANGHVFLAPNNGLLTRLADDPGFTAVYRITAQELFSRPLAEASADWVLPRAAGLIAAGTRPAELGEPLTRMVRLTIPAPARRGTVLSGAVICVSGYGDCLTNIPAAMVRAAGLTPGDEVILSWRDGRVRALLAQQYGDARPGAPAVVLGDDATVAFGLNQSDFAGRYGVTSGMAITIGPAGQPEP
jgi:S-adenosylmethionine hydrolase